MCGVLGLLGSDIKDNGEESFREALEALYKRGPDESGVYFKSLVRLGCRRLKIIGLDNGNQPLSNEDNTLIMVFNGEVYNYKDLKESLRSKGHKFKTDSDAEVVIHLYEEFGPGCLEHIKGMFAFAVYNDKDQSLFIARDRFGIKPLFYFSEDGRFIFSSSIKAIIRLLGYKPRLSNKGLNLYFWLDYIPSPYTIYQGIHSLLPSHYLTFSKDRGLNINRYYTLGSVDYGNRSKPKIASDIRAKISNSVRDHLIADVEPGLFLSGGLDSSIIAFDMKDNMKRFKSFNIGFQSKSFDESKYAALVAEKLGIEQRSRDFCPHPLSLYLERIISDLDQPFADHSLLPTYFLSEFASKHLKVALSGDGGDEVFCGYQTYIAHRIFSIYKIVPLKIRERILRVMLTMMPPSDRYFSLNFCLDRFSRSQSMDDLIRHTSWMESFGEERKSLLSWRYEDVENDYIDLIQDKFITVPEGLTKIQQFDIYSYLSNDILYKADFAGMSNSLEVRVPYLDKDLVESGLSLPEKLKLSNLAATKQILRYSYKDILPNSIIKRKKAGFSLPVSSILRFELGDLLEDLIQKGCGLDYLNRDYIKSILSQHLQYKKNNRKMLWNILVFLIWSMKNE